MWQDIVSGEVTSCLKSCDFADAPLLTMVNLVCVYDRLHRATIELFGGHSQLALALKDGFSSAYQSLNEVTGVRVREEGL